MDDYKPWRDLPVLQTREDRVARAEEIPVFAAPAPTSIKQLRRMHAEHRYKRAERERRYNHEVLQHPQGRVCLIAQCKDCKRFCRDRWDSTGRKRWGLVAGRVPRSLWWWDEGICNDCQEHNKQSSTVAQCERCKKFKKESSVGVFQRWDCRDHKDYEMKAPTLCVACWNQERVIWNRWRDAEETRAVLNRFKRDINSLRRIS